LVEAGGTGAVAETRLRGERGWAGRLAVIRWARRKPLGTFAVIILVLLWTVCLLAPLIAPYSWQQAFSGPRLQAPSGAHLLGTDEVGHDVLSRMLYGGRFTLGISLLVTIAGLVPATALGVGSGYFAGAFDLVTQRIADAIQALPGLIVLMLVAAMFDGSVMWTMSALVILSAPLTARVLRAETLKVRQEQYIDAARALGASNGRILLRHILPNVAPLLIILFSLSAGTNLLIEAALSFLGVLNATIPDWGSMLNASAQIYMVPAPWLAIAPGAAISIAVFCYNISGDAVRDLVDPRLRA